MCFSESYGVQHSIQKDPGGISPTFASGNRQTSLNIGYGTGRSLWTGSSVSSPWSSGISRVLIGMDTHRQGSLCRVSGFQRSLGLCWSKKTKKQKTTGLDILKWVGGTLPASVLTPKGHTLEQRTLAVSPVGEGREACNCLASPAIQDAAKETHFCPSEPRVLK